MDPDLVVRDAEGAPYTVRYEAVNAMLLNEFLKEHRKVEEQDRKGREQEVTISELKSTVGKQETMMVEQQKQIQALTASLKEQAAQIQKVSAELEVSRAAPQVACLPAVAHGRQEQAVKAEDSPRITRMTRIRSETGS